MLVRVTRLPCFEADIYIYIYLVIVDETDFLSELYVFRSFESRSLLHFSISR